MNINNLETDPNSANPVGKGCRTPATSVLIYDTKQSDGEALLLELRGIWSTL